MINRLDSLYREVILEHFKNSSRSGELPGAHISVDGSNPLCGDEITFMLRLNGKRIEQVRFKAKGCAISQAAASMFSEQMEGKTIADVRQLIKAMRDLMQGKEPDSTIDLGDLEALSGVRKFPVRIKCAALSWNIVEQGLAEYAGTKAPSRKSQIPNKHQ